MGETILVTLNIAVPASDIFTALTAADQLEIWFSEEADVSLEQNRFDFWGRFTPENPRHEDGHHEILSVDPDRALTFGWRLRGADTTVAITLTPEGDETAVELLHSHVPPRALNDYSVADFWLLSLENLRSWCERSVVGGRCDYSAPQHDGVTLDLEIDASPDVVFATLIEPGKLNRYMARDAKVEPRVGGRIDFGWGVGGPVKIVDLVPNQRLAYEWGFEGEPDTLVTWTLEGSGGRTRLSLRHSGFGDDGYQEGYRTGWQHFLNYIKALAEVGDDWSIPKLTNPDYRSETTTVA